MKRSDIDVDKSFVDMGLDSIIGVEWTGTINKRYGVSIAATKVYDHPTVREFARFLGAELAKRKTDSLVVPLKPTAAPSVDETLLRLQQGTLDIEQAERLLQQLHYH